MLMLQYIVLGKVMQEQSFVSSNTDQFRWKSSCHMEILAIFF